MILLISALFAVAFAGLTVVLMRALGEGAERYTGAYSEETARQFEDVFLFIPPRRIAEMGYAAAISVFLLVFLVSARFDSARGIATGLAVAAACGGATLAAPTALLGLLRRRRLARFNLQLGDTLVSMSNALKAGFSLNQAFESVVREGERPISQEFDLCLQQTRVGVPFSQALDHMGERVASEDLRLVIVAIETARRTGGNLTEIFEQLAATIRERLRIEGRIRTLTAQGRLQGIIVSLMPVVIGVALLIVDPELMLPFLHSTEGMLTLAVMAVLISLGGLTIRKIIRIDV